jgi:hypothetical protein
MSQINLKSVGRTDPELKQLLQNAIDANARIFAIIMEGDAGTERSINYRFSLEDSAAMLSAIQSALSPKLSKIDISTVKPQDITANPDAVIVAEPIVLPAEEVLIDQPLDIKVVME